VLATGSIIICHLVKPTEKFWGVLQNLESTGLVIRGINIASFDDWMMQAARNESPSLGLSTMFVPIFRIERIFLDEQVGEVESYRQRFESRVGVDVESFLDLERIDGLGVPS
jgi:hypothetical protein